MSVSCSIFKKYNFRSFCGLMFMIGLSANLQAQTSAKFDQKSSFKASLFNLEAAANETFRYSATLHNTAAEPRYYALSAKLPPGWFATFRTMGSQVTSVQLDAGKTQEVSIEINASPYSKPEKYGIPVTAVSAGDTLMLNLEAVLKGAYAIELTTPSGRLSEEVTEGSVKEIVCTVKNTGTLPLSDVELTSQVPPKWQVTFEPSKIERIDPAGSVDVKATVSVPDKTIAGDYVSTFTVRNQNVNSNASFRITVRTSVLSGWFGILVILAAIGLVYRLISKYGRR